MGNLMPGGAISRRYSGTPLNHQSALRWIVVASSLVNLNA